MQKLGFAMPIGKTVDKVPEVIITNSKPTATPGVTIIEYKLPALDIQSGLEGYYKISNYDRKKAIVPVPSRMGAYNINFIQLDLLK